MKTIFLIDSDAGFLESIAKILTRLGYVVIATQSDAAALRMVKEGMPIDALITDHKIGGINGLDVIAGIKKIAPGVPAILMSSDASIEAYLKALSLGVFEYLSKPIPEKEFDRVVSAALQREIFPIQV
jgi:DNA-binding NtrC family response regulator